MLLGGPWAAAWLPQWSLGGSVAAAGGPKFVFDVEHGTTKLTPYAIGPDEAVWRGSEVKMSKPTLWHLERRAEEEREAKEEM